jgi:hypothetical protein
MWISRPVYEVLPYLYIAAGGVIVAAAWWMPVERLPSIMLVVGALMVVAGLVIALKRRDYRASQRDYDSKSLDRE